PTPSGNRFLLSVSSGDPWLSLLLDPGLALPTRLIRGWRGRARRHLGLLGAEGGLEQCGGHLGREALDDGDIQAAALDDEEALAQVAPERITEGSGRFRDVAQLRGLGADVGDGELARVVLAVPGGQPDQAEAVVGALEDGIAIAVPAGGG